SAGRHAWFAKPRITSRTAPAPDITRKPIGTRPHQAQAAPPIQPQANMEFTQPAGTTKNEAVTTSAQNGRPLKRYTGTTSTVSARSGYGRRGVKTARSVPAD